MGRSAHSRDAGVPYSRALAAFLIVNPRSAKAGPSHEGLSLHAERLGIQVHVLREGEDPAEVARSAQPGALGVAGGDGSLAPVAQVALEHDVPFVCVPFGTRNHFARDLGLDRDDPLAALKAFAGAERLIDVGYADDRLFLNNVSLGAYARLVRRRERNRRRREAFARLRAWTALATKRRPLGVTIDGEPVETRILLVANNAYGIDFPTIGARDRLDGGRLHLYVPGDERVGEHFVVDAAAGRLEAAVDGEPEVLRTPIEFRIEPHALRVLVPERSG